MNMPSRSGFSMIELIVVILTIVSLSAVLIPARKNSQCLDNARAIAIRGRDIYVAIVRANTEREPLGLPTVWPADRGEFDFPNSTEYFRYLYDEEHAETETWNPLLSGFDYSKLSGAGVPHCEGKRLTADCNMWTIAKNMRDDMDDAVPLLITRNIDTASLTSENPLQEFGKNLRFDNDWKTPFGSRNFVLIRKGGAVFTRPVSSLPYRIVYKQPHDSSFRQERHVAQTAKPRQGISEPLKYLTPTREVMPGDMIHTNCQERQAEYMGMLKRAKRELEYQGEMVRVLAIILAGGYLLILGISCQRRWHEGVRPVLSGRTVFTVFFHYCAVMLYTVLTAGLVVHSEFWLTVFALAVAVQATGLHSVFLIYRSARFSCWDGIKLVLSAPLVVILIGLVVVLLGIFVPGA